MKHGKNNYCVWLHFTSPGRFVLTLCHTLWKTSYIFWSSQLPDSIVKCFLPSEHELIRSSGTPEGLLMPCGHDFQNYTWRTETIMSATAVLWLELCFLFFTDGSLFVCIHVFVSICMCLLLCVSVSYWSNGSRGSGVWLRVRDNSFSSMIWFMGAVVPIGKNKVWSNLICLAFQLSFSIGKYHEKAEGWTCFQCRLWSSGTRNMQIEILDYVNMQACKYRMKM